jgi:hypothetical protein
MKHEMNDQELKPDPLVAAALRWADGEVPMDDVDWAAMRTNIRHRASLPLARRRALEAASPRWVRPLLPIAAAASIAALLWTGGLDFGASTILDMAPVTVGAAYPSTIQEALLSDVSDQEFRLLMAGRNDADELLLIAAGQR